MNDRAVHGGQPPGSDGWVGRDELIDRCRLDGLPGIRPHGEQSLTSVHPLLLQLLGEEGWTPRVWAPRASGARTVRVRPGRALVVLAMDGVGFDLAAEAWGPDGPDGLWPLTSTFPSTSATAWLTSTTGLGVDRHLVPGVRYAVAAGGDRELLFDCFSDRPLASSNGDGPADAAETAPVVGQGRTVFEAATEAGAAAVAVLGDLASLPGRWSAALLRGAVPVAPEEPVEGLRLRPSDMVAAAVRDVDRVLDALAADRPTLAWTFVHVDPYAHAFGYDEAFAAAVATAQDAARRWAAAGHVVVAHADHGLTAARPEPGLQALWDETADDPSRCRLPSGGAGRVRWAYPRAGAEEEVAGRLAEGLGEEAAVLAPRDLERLGLLRLSEGLRGRIGEVVAVATGDRFPIPERGGRAEHGSVSPEEMLVPFAVWAPAG